MGTLSQTAAGNTVGQQNTATSGQQPSPENGTISLETDGSGWAQLPSLAQLAQQANTTGPLRPGEMSRPQPIDIGRFDLYADTRTAQGVHNYQTAPGQPPQSNAPPPMSGTNTQQSDLMRPRAGQQRVRHTDISASLVARTEELRRENAERDRRRDEARAREEAGNATEGYQVPPHQGSQAQNEEAATSPPVDEPSFSPLQPSDPSGSATGIPGSSEAERLLAQAAALSHAAHASSGSNAASAENGPLPQHPAQIQSQQQPVSEAVIMTRLMSMLACGEMTICQTSTLRLVLRHQGIRQRPDQDTVKRMLVYRVPNKMEMVT